MKRLVGFIKSQGKFLFLFVIFSLTFLSIFILADLDMNFYFLALQIISFFILVYLAINFSKYKEELIIKDKYEALLFENKSLRSDFISNKKDLEEYFLMWAHQIKTPITVAKLILNKKTDEDSKRLKEEIFYIEEYTNMAINYLKISSRGPDMDLDYVDLDEIVKEILKKYSIIFINKKISLNYQPINRKIISDSKLLSIMLEQIIANALKYTEKGSISITYSMDRLRVRDTGIGIRSEDLRKIFDRGYSGFNGRVNQKSSGLGLYLVRKIGQILNIKVEVESTLNVGSEFSLIFPNNLTKM
ncbi:ATPase/histidine kinase/DNA gyrase B/HSP90 domain protein [Anaerococcus tetradius]|uniref:histidine kinase n=2 Tax=Anaerococcus tetradius TaxID=33036 RepID=A0A133KHK5_9FIRM|nr:ATPase/histidine kinase/DNA gyrase B/HSP90 domain protein [Anaerococcus tetradius]